jgi:heavy metal sensor kinase
MNKPFKPFFNSTRFKVTLWYSALFLILEILLGVIIYVYLNKITHTNLDSTLKAQAKAILRIVEEKHVDLETFKPGDTYQTEDELIWDVIYDAIVFNKRNNFVEILSPKKIIFKTANLGKFILSYPNQKEKEALFDVSDPNLSEDLIRVCQLKGRRYTIVVAYPKEYINQTLNNLQSIYEKIAPLFLLISFIGGALLSSKSLSRIDAIIKKTEEITAQNLDEIIPGGEYTDEYGRLVSKMNEMIRRIKKSVDYMNQFSISAAHELKTPLTILRGEIEITLKSPKTPSQYVETLKSNYEETIRLIKIVDNVFFISKSENTLINIDKKEIELNNYLISLVNSMGILGKEKEMELLFDSDEIIKLKADPILLKQALSNLIDNAFKYGNEKTIVHVETKSLNNSIQINVTNTGEPIPQAAIDKIFDRFYRVANSRTGNTGGMGLGLAVVKSIMELHKGEVRVTSSENSLTTLSLIFPIC